MSLRGRLLVGMGVIALVLVVASVFITRNTESYLIERVDAQLTSAVPPLRREGGPVSDPSRTFTQIWVGVVNGDGSVTTVVTPGFGPTADLPVLSPAAALSHATETTHDPFTVGSNGDTRYRLVAVRDERLGRTLLLGLPLNDVDAAITRLLTIEALATATTLAIFGLVIWWVIRLGVRPIKQMTATATAIAGGDLSHRVPDLAGGTEAGELGIALNAMLGSIEEAFDERAATEDRLRRFAADASHELRTPVTTIRGYAELYRTGGLREPDELDQAMRRTEQEAIRMGSLIEDLLLLARLDQGRPLELADVDLGALATDAARDAAAVAPDRDISTAVETGVVVRGDEARLHQVVANLVGNALVHTPPGTPVELRVQREGDHGVLEVVDHGPGIAPDVADHAFERFYRADPSRSRHRGGSGLGLSIVDAIVTAHGGAVGLTSSTPPGSADSDGATMPGTTARVLLPLAANPVVAEPDPR
jgi:two-component system OmpR family sensor kinase